MKQRKCMLLLLFSTILLSAMCRRDSENCHHTVKVHNTSNKAIYASFYPHYPDTALANPSPALSPETFKLEPNETKSIYNNQDCVEVYYQHVLDSDTLMLFVFDAEVLESTSWEEVMQNYSILKRFDLSLQDLRDRNFTIEFQ